MLGGVGMLWLIALALFAPLGVVAGLNYRERRAAARAAAEEREREQRAQEEEAEAEQRQREAGEAQAREGERRDRVLRQLPTTVERMQLNEEEATAIRREREQGLRDRAKRMFGASDTLREMLPPGMGPVIAAVVLGGIFWTLLVVSNFVLDVKVFQGLGHGLGLASLLAFVLVVLFSLVGLILWDCLSNSTSMFPMLRDQPTRTRRAIATGVTLATLIVLSSLPKIVEHRSADISRKVSSVDVQLAALPSATAPEVRQTLENRLEDRREELTSAKSADTGLAIGAAVGEMATSWAATWLGILLASAQLKRRGRAAEEGADALARESEGAERRIRGTLLEMAEREDFSPEELMEALAPRSPRGLGAGTDGAANGAGSSSTTDNASAKPVDDAAIDVDDVEVDGHNEDDGGPGHHDHRRPNFPPADTFDTTDSPPRPSDPPDDPDEDPFGPAF